jgi:hypothetical protein
MWKWIAKALVAGGSAFIAAEVGAAINAGGYPGWPETGAAFGLGVAAGWATFKTRNGPQPVPAAAVNITPKAGATP